jgi:ATP-dependent Clp protease ATP-binding subunit ClpC
MYERFTDTARKSMRLANKVAQRYHHEYVGTEHILLGIVEEGSGVAVTILKDLNVNPKKLCLRVEEIVQNGPDPMTMGKLPQTPRAKKVIEYAMEEARNLKHNYVGTEHMLLGLLREKEGVAGQVLMDFGVRPDDVRREIVKLSLREPGAPDQPEESETPATTSPYGAQRFGSFVGRVARALGLVRSVGGRSTIVPSDPKELEQEIERLNIAKEEAIANQDFERAARLRDEADELKRRWSR